MILAISLLTVAGLLLFAGPRLLMRWTSHGRAPLSCIVAWQLASWCAVASVMGAAALLTAPSLAAAGRLPAGLEACLTTLHRSLGNPADSRLVQNIAAGVLGVLLLRLTGCATRLALDNHRRRTRQRALLTMVGKTDAALGAVVVPDPTAAVYCFPGRGGRIVFTVAAVARLTSRQRAAVLAHEHAHLRSRHHLLIASASLLSRAFPTLPLFRLTRQRTIHLVELHADDVAARGHGRRSVAEALLALAVMDAAPGVLAATAVRTAERIERLLAPPPSVDAARSPLSRRAAVALLSVTTLAAAPILLAVLGHVIICLI